MHKSGTINAHTQWDRAVDAMQRIRKIGVACNVALSRLELRPTRARFLAARVSEYAWHMVNAQRAYLGCLTAERCDDEGALRAAVAAFAAHGALAACALGPGAIRFPIEGAADELRSTLPVLAGILERADPAAVGTLADSRAATIRTLAYLHSA